MWSGKEFNNSFNPSELSVGLKLMLKEMLFFSCKYILANIVKLIEDE